MAIRIPTKGDSAIAPWSESLFTIPKPAIAALSFISDRGPSICPVRIKDIPEHLHEGLEICCRFELTEAEYWQMPDDPEKATRLETVLGVTITDLGKRALALHRPQQKGSGGKTGKANASSQKSRKPGKWDHVWEIIKDENAVEACGKDQKIANKHNRICTNRINEGKCEKIDAQKVAQIRYEFTHPDRHRKQNHKK